MYVAAKRMRIEKVVTKCIGVSIPKACVMWRRVV